MRIAKKRLTYNKTAFSIFYSMIVILFQLVVIPFRQGSTLAFSGMSIFFLIGLVMLISFNLLYMTSFATGEALIQLVALPFSRYDLSLITIMTFFRLVDIPVAIFVFGFTTVYGLLTQSIVGVALVLVFSVSNALIGIFLTFFLPRAFYARILSTGGARPQKHSQNSHDTDLRLHDAWHALLV